VDFDNINYNLIWIKEELKDRLVNYAEISIGVLYSEKKKKKKKNLSDKRKKGLPISLTSANARLAERINLLSAVSFRRAS
jgi:hypothetical protein